MLPLDVSGAIKMVLVSEAWTSLLLCSQRRFGKLSSLLFSQRRIKMQAAPNNLAAQR